MMQPWRVPHLGGQTRRNAVTEELTKALRATCSDPMTTVVLGLRGEHFGVPHHQASQQLTNNAPKTLSANRPAIIVAATIATT